MRLSVKGFLAAVCLGAMALFVGCAADSPTSPHVTPGGSSSGGLSIQLSTTNASPIAGQCTLIEGFATFNGSAVPDGTSILFSTNLGGFAQNSSNNVSLTTQGGSATAVLCSASQGTATVRATVTYQNKTATRTLTIQFSSNGIPTCPFVTQCAVPSSGPVTGGTAITITGCGFGTDASQVRVFFKHGSTIIPGTVTGVTDTSITAITPSFPGLDATAATPVDLEVVLGAGFTLTSPSCFTYTGTGVQPAVNAILPSSGTKLGGTRVTIFGSGFTAPVQVTFGGGQGSQSSPLQAEVLSVTFNQIIAQTPPATSNGTVTFPETVPVIVKNVACQPTGTLTCQSNGSTTYTYTTPLQIYGNLPAEGPPGTLVTIFGTGFVPPVEVGIGGAPAQVSSVTGTEIMALAPLVCGASAGEITVTNLSTGESATGGGFTLDVTKITSGPTPSSGPGGQATNVTLFGTALVPSTLQTNGGTATVVSSSTLPSGNDELVLALTPDPCVNTETVTILNSVTGCFVTFNFQNSTPIQPLSVTGTATNGGLGDTFTFNATVTGGLIPLTYTWNFGDASAPVTVGPTSTRTDTETHTYAPGNYQASLTVSDSCVPPRTFSLTFNITAP